MRLKSVAKLCFAGALSISCSLCTTPTIGVASAIGTFTVNDAKVEGNANVFEGSQIKTGTASSRVYLQSGADLTLGINSAGTFFKDHVLLEQGATRVGGMNHYVIQAGPYRIQSAEPVSEAVVRLADGEVQIAALSGALNVFSTQGALLTRIGAGTASAFQNTPTQTGQSGATANPPSGATAQTGAASSAEEARIRRHREERLFTTLGVALAGLGLATDAILQPTAPTPTSP